MQVLPRAFGKFVLLDELGRGTSGIVYKAQDKELDRVVAIKVLREEEPFSDTTLERFQREARLAARLNHESVIKVHEAGILKNDTSGNSVRYFTMDLVEGVSLDRLLAQRGKFSPLEAAALVAKVAEALSHAHEGGIVHRDLKPANIIVTPTGVPVITDFGIAKQWDQTTLTEAGELLGTPHYMAPEQVAGQTKEIDAQTDVYSLGAILYELLTTHAPFEADNFFELSFKVQHEEPLSLLQIDSEIPRALNTICLKALQKEKKHRYATARDFASDLQRFLHGEPILAKPLSSFQKGVRWFRRHKIAVIMVSLLAASGITFFIYGALMTRPLEQALRDAEAHVSIITTPAGAEVELISSRGERKSLGKTPTDGILLFRDVYTLCLRMNGFVSVEIPISIEEKHEYLSMRLYRKEEIPENMVYVPSGYFYMPGSLGRSGKDIKTAPQKVYVKAFFIDKYEVTNAQYKQFVGETGHKAPTYWKGGSFSAGEENYPVVMVTYADAKAYAGWARKRLPTAEEWEKAARGVDGRTFPWGNDFDERCLNCSHGGRSNTGIEPVGKYPLGKSPYGCYDMAGNVWELTSTTAANGRKRVVKGGSCAEEPRYCTTFAYDYLPSKSLSDQGAGASYSKYVGFRCVKDAPE